MQTQPPNPPRRKLRFRWILAALFLLFAVWFCYQLIGPNPAILVSKETTFITEPLGPDGLPDYEAYLLQQGRKGVTLENNAAVLIWQAMWPGELEQEYWLLMCDELGMKKVPSAKDGLVSPYDSKVRDQIALELAQRFSENTTADPKEDYFSETWQRQLRDGPSYALVDEAMSRPWTSEQIPALATWVEQNQKPLDLLVEATQRTHFFSPSPNHLDGSQEGLVASLLPMTQGLRGAAKALHVRAMWFLGKDQPEEAWRDVRASLRLSQFAADGSFAVKLLVGIAIENMTYKRTVLILLHNSTTPALAQQIRQELIALPSLPSLAYVIDQGERLTLIDCALAMATGGRNDVLLTAGETIPFFTANWKLVLKDLNEFYDRMAEAARMPTRSNRSEAWFVLVEEIQTRSTTANNQRGHPKLLFNRNFRSKQIANILLALLAPDLESAFNAEDRANTQLELTRLAAALAVYRAEQGAYPEHLADLMPGVLPKLPVDLYSGKSFLYERKDDGGFLLYSVFENEIDDGGDSMSGAVINGQWVDQQPEDFSYAESDLVIRVPVPAFQFPSPPSEARTATVATASN